MKNSHLLTALVLGSVILGSIMTLLVIKPTPLPPPPPIVDPCEYQMNVTDDSITIYDGNRVVGTVKIQGQLDSLITLDNL